MRHVAANALTILIVILLALAGVAAWGVKQWSAEGPLSGEATVMVEKGDGVAAISARLEEAGAISDARIFRVGVKYAGLEQSMKFGEYLVPAGASMKAIAELLASGRSVQHPITIVEGWSVWQAVEAIKAEEVLVGEITNLPPEGMIAPETYSVQRGEQRQAVLDRMVKIQERILDTAWENRAEGLPIKTKEEALILASIIEKETGIEGERPMIAGVFVNRLRRGMPLQTDPTVIYGILKGEGSLGRGLRRSELDAPTPWNTYKIQGLPPTPIANPGKAAIAAAVQPAETQALYFVADGTGGHVFSNSLAEHNRNVAKWREIERARQIQ